MDPSAPKYVDDPVCPYAGSEQLKPANARSDLFEHALLAVALELLAVDFDRIAVSVHEIECECLFILMTALCAR